ncbi:hypothetical protein ACWEJ6_52145 [Nonomuraea sp. NPDC004702]
MRVKQVLKWVGGAFVVFFLFTRPASAAAAVNGAFNGIVQGANQLAVFATNLLA